MVVYNTAGSATVSHRYIGAACQAQCGKYLIPVPVPQAGYAGKDGQRPR